MISYKFNDKVSIGFGAYASYNQTTLAQYLNAFTLKLESNSALGSSTHGGFDIPFPGMHTGSAYSGDGRGEFDLSDWGWGYTIGIMYQVIEDFRLGWTYHSKVRYNLEGDLTVTYPSASSAAPTGTNCKLLGQTITNCFNGSVPAGEITPHVKTSLTTPESVDFALAWDIDERWILLAGATWTRWSRYQEVLAEYKNTDVNVAYVPFEWDDVWAYGIGATFQLDDKWLLRWGYAYDGSPSPDDTLNVVLPVEDSNSVSFGFKYSVKPQTGIDVAVGYLWQNQVDIEDENIYRASSGTALSGFSFNGEYDIDAWILAVGFSHNY